MPPDLEILPRCVWYRDELIIQVIIDILETEEDSMTLFLNHE